MAPEEISQNDMINEFTQFSTCDISDALLKLKQPRGGFLPGLTMWSPKRQEGNTKIIGPAYTVKFVPLSSKNAPILKNHYIDTIPSGSIIFITAPQGVFNACYGGLMSHRARFQGALGTVVDGNFRDLDEQRKLGFPVFARDVSTPSFYEVARPSEVNVPVTLQGDDQGPVISPGDLIVADLNGVVFIPKALLREVLDLLPGLTAADAKVEQGLGNGITFEDASRTHRRK